jgi:exoribonuclease R
MLDLAQDLSNLLVNMRKRRGEIDFDINEAKVLVNEDGIPTDVQVRERTILTTHIWILFSNNLVNRIISHSVV